MRRNLFLEQLNSRGERSAPLNKCACHPIITVTLTNRQLILQLFPPSPRLQIIPQSPAADSSCFIPVSRFHLPHPRRRSGRRSIRQPGEAVGGEKDPVHTFNMGWKCAWSCVFFTSAVSHLQKKKKRAGPNPGPPRSCSTVAFVSLKLVSLFSRGLSLIRTGSRVIDVSAEVRTTASITVGISSFVTRWRHRLCFDSLPFHSIPAFRVGRNRCASLKYSHLFMTWFAWWCPHFNEIIWIFTVLLLCDSSCCHGEP